MGEMGEVPIIAVGGTPGRLERRLRWQRFAYSGQASSIPTHRWKLVAHVYEAHSTTRWEFVCSLSLKQKIT